MSFVLVVCYQKPDPETSEQQAVTENRKHFEEALVDFQKLAQTKDAS